MTLYKFIIPLGIFTYIFLLLTTLSGFLVFKFHIKWLTLKWHIRLGVLTIILATLHAGIVVYVHR